ncbi:MAG TPA: antibiotic biosynthesis monooxygenase [Pyrinomonadaceae bacterium]|jgi:heme-degrading monooxygenase HmoA|nr:antibiotic biosynthesis monooxygenase [Pyrinomonadaceae bacterium]
MIVRIWTTRLADGREDEYLAFARERSRAMFLSQPGCLGVLFLKAEDGRHAACSFWKSAADVRALASSPSYNETATALAATGALSGESAVIVYEVEGGAFDGPALAQALGEFGRSSG